MKFKDLTPELKGTLDHFIDQGKHPIRVNKKEAELIKKHFKFLNVKFLKNEKSVSEFDNGIPRNYLITLSKKIPDSVLAEYWKMRHDESEERFYNLSEKIRSLV